jgi:putative transposase
MDVHMVLLETNRRTLGASPPFTPTTSGRSTTRSTSPPPGGSSRSVVDEFTRESLADVVEHSIDADATVATLGAIVGARGTHPRFIRCDNGPELTANALRDWCRFGGTGTSYIEPGSPWQNPWVESYGSRMRDELLAIEQFDSRLEGQVLVADWRAEYNDYRPHSALEMLTPAEFARRWRTNQPQLS